MTPGVPYITNHELRHSFASLMNREGVNSQTISQLMGHKTKSVTEGVYLHATQNEKDDAMIKLNDIVVRYLSKFNDAKN